MTRIAALALLSHWRRRPGQLATLLVGLALATALWSAVQAINSEARRSYDEAAGRLGLGGVATLERPGAPLTIEDFAALRRAGWLVSPVLEGRLPLPGDGVPIRVVGLDLLSAPPSALPPGLTAIGPDTSPADLFAPPGLAIAAPDTVARLRPVFAGDPAAPAPSADRVIPDLPADHATPPLRADRAMPPGELLTDIGTAERLLDAPGEITRLMILPAQPMGRPPLSAIAPDLVRQEAQAEGEIGRLTSSFHLNLTAFGLLSFGVGLFIVHGAIGLAFEQRRGTIRTLRAMGLPTGRLVAVLLAETVAMALLAGTLGLALGYAIAAVLLPDVAATLRGLYGAAVPGTLRFDPLWALAGLAMALAGALVAAAQGLAQVARMPLLASARPRAWATVSERALRLQAGAGLAALAAGIAAPVLGSGLVAGFGLLGGLLLGAALLLPLALGRTLGLAARRARGPLAQWFWADTRQQLPGLSLALMALLLALAANIGVGTMVGSFRLTFTGWLDQRLAADLYVDTRDAAEAGALRGWAAARGVDLLPRARAETRLAGMPGTLEGIVDHPVYRRNWPLLAGAPGVWDRLAAGEALLVNEQLARRAGLALGDPVEILPGWSLPVAGIYSDYGNPRGQGFVALDSLTARFPDAAVREFGLVAPGDSLVTGGGDDTPQAAASDDLPRAEALRAALIAETPLTEGQVIDQEAIKAISLRIFERTFAVTGALNVLTLAVAGIAMLTALTTLAAMRLPQLAPVWALGLTRAQLAGLELGRTVMLAALTFIAALPLGLAVAWALLAVVNVEAFGWRLPMHVFPAGWAALLALSLAAAGLAALLPARRLARTPPAAFLKVFADER